MGRGSDISQRADRPVNDLHRASLLVVDDDPALLRVLAMQFEQEGYIVRTASDGLSAIETMQAHHPDVVVLDVMMPGISGLEVCSRIRADPELASITVLVLTARDAMEEPAFAAGADGFLSKPYDLRKLSALVRDMVALGPAVVGGLPRAT